VPKSATTSSPGDAPWERNGYPSWNPPLPTFLNLFDAIALWTWNANALPILEEISGLLLR
jgi:hypothetical protein